MAPSIATSNLIHKLASSFPSFYSLIPLVLCALAVSWLLRRGKHPRHDFFPSPPSDPILGHLRIMPPKSQWLTFAEWGKKLGDVIYLSIVGRPMIILNSAESARDLMDKRGANYSDRPLTVLHGEMINWGNFLALVHYGDQFRFQRRLMQQYINSQASVSLRPLQTEQVRILVQNLLDTPADFRHHINRMSSASLVKMTYGHDIVSNDDNYIRLAVDATSRGTEAGVPGLTPVDLFPILRHIPAWFPGARFKRETQSIRRLVEEQIDSPYAKVKEERASGTAQPSLINSLLEYYENSQAIDDDIELNIKNVGGQMYSAGVETSEVTVLEFILMMTLHPEVMRRAQAEIDSVTGGEHLPTLEDRSSLPYIDCILKEVWRINPPVPLGIPHRSMEDDIYRDKVVPAGSMVISNIWNMMRDERYFNDPEKFNPERFLKKGARSVKDSVHALNSFNANDPSSLVFGFGRRICPGRFFADASAWLVMANILAVFDILPVIDPITGNEILPVVEHIPGLSNKPKPFDCRFVPRSAKHALLIRQLDLDA